MSNSSHPQSFDNTNGDELDQKNNNRADLNEIKLTVKDDDQQQRLFAQDGALPLQVHQNAAQRRPGESLATGPAANQSNSPMSNGAVDDRLCNAVTADRPDSSQNGRSDSNADQQSLPPAYFEVPGIVPFMAASSNQPPPSYEEVINPDVPPPTYSSLFGQVQAARKNAKTLPDLIKKLIIILLGTIGLAVLISFTVLIPFTMILVGGSNLDNCRAEKIPLFLLVGGITWLAKNLSNFFSQCSSRRTARSTNSSSSTAANGSRNTNACSSSTANACSGGNSSSSNHPCASRYSSNTCAAESNACQPSTNRSSRCVINLENEQQTTLESQQNKRRDFLINCFITAWFITGCVMVYRVYPPNYTDPTHPNYCNKTVYVYAFWLLTSTFIIFAFFIGCICCVSLTAIFSSNSEIRI